MSIWPLSLDCLFIQLSEYFKQLPPLKKLISVAYFEQCNSIKCLYELFKEEVTKYEDMWDQLEELDRNSWVLEPEGISYGATYRRIALGIISLYILIGCFGVSSNLPLFLAHLWGAYAIPLALSVVRRPSSVVNRPSSVVCRLCPP